MNQKRNSNLELLRIFSIIGITVHHLLYHSDIMSYPLGVNRLFAQLFIMFGKFGVNIFVLISAYFLVANGSTDYKKSLHRVLKPWKQTLIYSILGGLAAFVLFRDSINAGKLLNTVFPIFTGHYWFMTSFVGLMILEPFLNRFAHRLEKQDYQKFLIAIFVITILPIKNTWCNDLLWFIALYFTAGYIRLFNLKFLNTQKKRMIVALACILFMWLSSIAISLLSNWKSAFSQYINYFALRQNSIPMYLGCIATFLFVAEMRPRQSAWVNRVAAHVLACYLIQSNTFISGRLWNFVDEILPKQSAAYPLFVMGVVLLLTVVFMGIDIIVVSAEKAVTSLAGVLPMRKSHKG